MGKKTLEEIGKILLVSVISILISVVTTRRALLDSKVDKTEYNQDKIEHEKRHEQEHSDMEYVRDRVDKIYDHLLQEGHERRGKQ